MRKMQVIVESDGNEFMAHVNSFFAKLEKMNFAVVKTDYTKGSLGNYVAFIDYESKPLPVKLTREPIRGYPRESGLQTGERRNR